MGGFGVAFCLFVCLFVLVFRKLRYKMVFKCGVVEQERSDQVDKLLFFLNIEICVDLSLKIYTTIFSYLKNYV